MESVIHSSQHYSRIITAMKSFFTTACLFAMTGMMALYAADLKENFETGLPSSAPATETTVKLASGTWTLRDVYAKKDNGSMRATMKGNGYLITPTLRQPGTISFKFRGSGNGKPLAIEKSADGGQTWTKIGTASASSSSSYGSGTYSAASAEGDTAVVIRFTCESATIYLDDITIAQNSVTAGGGDDEEYPGNPAPQDTIEWTGPHATEHAIYIAPWGNDKGDGTFENPYYNLQKAVDEAVAGDTIFVRGGTYYPTMMSDGKKTTVRINKAGTPDAWFTIKTFPGEFPVLNFKDQPKMVSVRGMEIATTAQYWHIYGLHITQAGDNGIKLEGSHNIIERCTFSYNDDSGLQLGFGHNFSTSVAGAASSNDGTWCAYNDIIDCDSYMNCDSDNFGSDADGFACKMHNGKGNCFIRCRAWDNSDDAWDLYETDFAVKMIECWAWGSGRASNFGWVSASGSFQGNGNGIKLGGNGSGGSSKGIHEAWRCVAFNNNKTGSVKGFDENHHKDGVRIVNCLAFGNGYDFMFEEAGASNSFFYNNVCFGKIEIGGGGGTNNNNAMNSTSTKAWTNNIVRGFSENDYVSLTEDDAKAPRAADGSLPTRFAKLKAGSVLIDRGLDMVSEMQTEFPFTFEPIVGSARDLGPYEYSKPGTSGTQMLIVDAKQLSLRANDSHIVVSVPADGRVAIDFFAPQGSRVAVFQPFLASAGAEYSLPIPALDNGVYIVRVCQNGQTRTAKVAVNRK